MSFKSELEKENELFFNLNEFAKESVVNGSTINAVFEADDYVNTDKELFQGLDKNMFNLYLKASDLFDLKLSVSTQADIDGSPYYIENISDDLGIITVKVSALVGR